MKRFIAFLREWTLPVAIALGIAVYLVFARVPALEGAATFFSPIIEFIFPWWIFFVLFATFCRIDFHKIRLVPWHHRITAVNWILTAAIVAIILLCKTQGNSLVMMECLLMCVIAPCASAAPVVTSRLDGNLEQMTTFVCLSNVIAAVLIPAVFPLIDKTVDMPFLPSFWLILKRVGTVLLVPMLLAYLVKRFLPRLHRFIVGHPNMAYYVWAFGLTIISGTTVKNIMNSDAGLLFVGAIAIVSLAVCLLQFALGRFIGRSTASTIESGQALGQKNTAFAIWVATAYLNPLSSVGPGCYILWQNLINSLEIHRHDRHLTPHKNEEQ